MDTPYGEVPDSYVKDMSVQDMHDYLRRRYSRRSVLKGAAAVGALAAAGPIFWKQSSASATGLPIPQWISYGPNPAKEMYISWSAGSYNTPASASNPQVRWGTDTTYGETVQAFQAQIVPIPSGYTQPSGDVDDTLYIQALITGLDADNTYHYSVSYDGVNWGPDATFTTAQEGIPSFRWVGTGDQAVSASSSLEIAEWVAAQSPAFAVVAGDLSYASGGEILGSPGTTQPSYTPSAWDSYFSIFGANGFQSLPVLRGVGNHEMEPLANHGYAGVLTRFPQNYDTTSGSPVTQSFTYGNVAWIMCDGNDLSAEITPNNGYTQGVQTTWLASQLAKYRAAGSNIDFIVVVFHNCLFCSNATHGSDAGIRNIWEPLFDQYQVDLVLNGHVHCYERSNPVKSGVAQTQAAPGSVVTPASQGTTYICAGGGGQSLYTSWYGVTGAGDSGSGTPFIDYWTGGDTASGGSGSASTEADPTYSASNPWSAFRKAVWSFIVVDVVAPSTPGGTTTMTIQAINPGNGASAESAVTSATPSYVSQATIGSEPSNSNVMDSVTLQRVSTVSATALAAVTPEVPNVALLGLAAGGLAGGAYLLNKKRTAGPAPA